MPNNENHIEATPKAIDIEKILYMQWHPRPYERKFVCKEDTIFMNEKIKKKRKKQPIKTQDYV